MIPEIMYPVVLAIGVLAFGVVCWILAHSYQGKKKQVEIDRKVQIRIAEIAGERRGRKIAGEIGDLSWPYCDQCRSWHHPQNPTCPVVYLGWRRG